MGGWNQHKATDIRTDVFAALYTIHINATDLELQGNGNHCHYLHVFFFAGFKCPVCSKFVSSDEMDLHLVLCLTKPRVTYNGKTDRTLL